jgi:GTP-binding protein 1
MILYHQTTIKPKYQAMLHVNATAQTCQIVSIEVKKKKPKARAEQIDDATDQILRTGDRGLVRFRFMQRAEYLKVGTKLIFREGRTKGLGTVTQVFPAKEAGIGSSGTVTSVTAVPETAKAQVRSPLKEIGSRFSAMTMGKKNQTRADPARG